MRRAARLALLLVALTASSVRADDPPPVEMSKAAIEAANATMPLLAEAQRLFAEKEWDASVAAYEKALKALGDDAALGGWRDQATYNLACAEARAGHADKAAAAFAKSVQAGLRPIVQVGPDGKWRENPGLTLEHLLADSDLDPIRKEAAYVAALKPYLAAGEPMIEFTGPETTTPVPAFVLLAAEGDDAERALPAWRIAAKDAAVALVALAGPVRPTPKDRSWILGDGDERWAVAKVTETLDAVSKDARIDGKRVFVVGAGERPGEAAWAVAMTESARLAGFAAPGARFHAAWHADAIAKLPETWRVALGTADEKAAKLLGARKIAAARIEPSNDEAKTAAAIFAALLAKP